MSMKVTWIAATGLLLTASAASAAPHFWQGVAMVESATAQCNVLPTIKVGQGMRAFLIPALGGPGGNGSLQTRLFFFTFAETYHMRKNAPNQSAFFNGDGTYDATAILRSTVGGANDSAYEGFVTTPASPLATTNHVTITGRIVDFFGIAGCNVDFRGNYQLNQP
jgi:hypothetical protein